MANRDFSILCVDDEAIPLELRKLVLQREGYEVVSAGSAVEAIKLLGLRQFNLVLTDQMMPGMPGTELTKHIKSTMSHMPVIIISGVNELPPGAELADRFISKVEGPLALLEAVSGVLKRYFPAAGTGNETV